MALVEKMACRANMELVRAYLELMNAGFNRVLLVGSYCG